MCVCVRVSMYILINIYIYIERDICIVIRLARFSTPLTADHLTVFGMGTEPPRGPNSTNIPHPPISLKYEYQKKYKHNMLKFDHTKTEI